MLAGAEMALEGFGPPLVTHREILFNLEINNKCAFTSRCADNCYLNALAVGMKPRSLPEESIMVAAEETIAAGAAIRHFAILGKEPLESSGLLLKILKAFHEAPKHTRPANIGIITAAARQLEAITPQLVKLPLDWLVVSIDSDDSGLRVPQNSKPLLQSALNARSAGATSRLGVNTTFNDANWKRLLELGHSFEGTVVDQWTVGPFLHAMDNRMVPAPTIHTIRQVIEHFVARTPSHATDISIELDYPQLSQVMGIDHPALRKQRWRWRTEIVLATNVRLIARNPRPCFFLRLRHDGQLLSREDFRRVGLREGTYGAYSAGVIERLIERFHSAIDVRDENLLHI